MATDSLWPAKNGMKQAKHIMEKRRRARINASLAQLKSLLPEERGREGACSIKMEKADILERAVEHLRLLQEAYRCSGPHGACDRYHPTRNEVLESYDQGYKECLDDVDNYIVRMRIDDPQLRTQVMGHIASRKTRFRQSYTAKNGGFLHVGRLKRNCAGLGVQTEGQIRFPGHSLSSFQHRHSPADSTTTEVQEENANVNQQEDETNAADSSPLSSDGAADMNHIKGLWKSDNKIGNFYPRTEEEAQSGDNNGKKDLRLSDEFFGVAVNKSTSSSCILTKASSSNIKNNNNYIGEDNLDNFCTAEEWIIVAQREDRVAAKQIGHKDHFASHTQHPPTRSASSSFSQSHQASANGAAKCAHGDSFGCSSLDIRSQVMTSCSRASQNGSVVIPASTAPWGCGGRTTCPARAVDSELQTTAGIREGVNKVSKERQLLRLLQASGGPEIASPARDTTVSNTGYDIVDLLARSGRSSNLLVKQLIEPLGVPLQSQVRQLLEPSRPRLQDKEGQVYNLSVKRESIRVDCTERLGSDREDLKQLFARQNSREIPYPHCGTHSSVWRPWYK